MRTYLMVVSLAMATPAAAEECKFDEAGVKGHFTEAYRALFDYQTYAYICAPSIGGAHAETAAMEFRLFLAKSGRTKNDAIIEADEVDKAAKARAAKSDLQSMAKGLDPTSIDVMNLCLETMNTLHRAHEVEQAKMMKSACQ